MQYYISFKKYHVRLTVRIYYRGLKYIVKSLTLKAKYIKIGCINFVFKIKCESELH